MDNAGQVELLLNELLKKRGNPTYLSDQITHYPAVRQLAEDFIILREFTNAISNGDLSQSLSMKGYWAGALKALQSNLRHLTWQTGMIASGDFSQRIDFMGDFSAAFNSMIQRLQQAEENEKKYLAELKKREAELKASEQKYRLIAENMDDVILLMDANLKVIYSSPSIERLLGYTSQDVIELSETEHILPPIVPALHKMEETRMEGHTLSPMLIEVEQRRKDGKMIWMESLISFTKNEDSEHIGFLCVIRDITQRKLAENHLHQSYERRLKNDFFNKLLNGNIKLDLEAYAHACRLGIHLPSQFSLYFLSIDNSDSFLGEMNVLEQKHKHIDAIIDQLTMQDGTIAWEVPQGVGIICSIQDLSDRQNKEMQAAELYSSLVLDSFPHLQVHIGIADYFDSLINFNLRFKHAHSSVRIGRGVWPNQRVYHFENCGIFQVLIPFADTDEAEVFIQRILGPLLEYDRKNQTQLVDTLEMILSGLSLKEVAQQTFFHYKTIQSRKQRIETILNVTLDSSEVRMMLGTAMNLLKIYQC